MSWKRQGPKGLSSLFAENFFHADIRSVQEIRVKLKERNMFTAKAKKQVCHLLGTCYPNQRCLEGNARTQGLLSLSIKGSDTAFVSLSLEKTPKLLVFELG